MKVARPRQMTHTHTRTHMYRLNNCFENVKQNLRFSIWCCADAPLASGGGCPSSKGLELAKTKYKYMINVEWDSGLRVRDIKCITCGCVVQQTKIMVGKWDIGKGYRGWVRVGVGVGAGEESQKRDRKKWSFQRHLDKWVNANHNQQKASLPPSSFLSPPKPQQSAYSSTIITFLFSV